MARACRKAARDQCGHRQQHVRDCRKPDQALVDKFAAVFLAGKPCGFTIDDVMKEVEAAQALKK